MSDEKNKDLQSPLRRKLLMGAAALPLIAAGKVKPVIFNTFPLKEAASAHALMESSTHIGKIVLTI